MKTIYLIGFMGSGKTTVGKALHELLQLPFVDTDQWIEEITGDSIPNIFQLSGEEAFRLLELQAIQELSKAIIATGGGIVEKEDNIEMMKQKGIIIYLKTSLKEISQRLQNDNSRPLWQTSISQREQLYQKRCHLYEKYADKTISTDEKTSYQIAQEIVQRINE
ncbi:shikimate kinase [Ornithinibacillus halophilus]|uniref:Shikimate kinase n=1 Tax=Ornithinibacillus halophilus TaxID=930117 RepID=A0A1M5D0S2_9BACI|nr:shikimate kinase [Ornithinibacillus halophilus]SHF60598.1 shikimate kinase [Ornithinibacillus halophilus]